MSSQNILESLAVKYNGTISNNGAMICCPCHNDTNPSLSVKLESDGKLLLHCFAGCDYADIRNRLKDDGFDSDFQTSGIINSAKRPEKKKPKANVIKKAQEIYKKGYIPHEAFGVFWYLKNKGIKDYFGSKVYRGNSRDSLIVPLLNNKFEIESIQFIDHGKPSKRFLPGSVTSGLFALINETNSSNKEVYVSEGFATACSIAMATNGKVFAALSCNNLEAVVESIIGLGHKPENIIIAADDDSKDSYNPGRLKATACAIKFHCKIVFPEFSGDRSDKNQSDFNDLHVLSGIAEVSRQLNNAKKIEPALQTQPETQSVDSWGVPKSLPKNPIAQALERGYMPKVLDDFVFDTAAKMRVPPEMVAAPMLTLLASLIGPACMLQPTHDVDWKITPTLWSVLIASPGSKKSPVLNRVLESIRDAEKKFDEKFDNQQMQWKNLEKKILIQQEIIKSKIKSEKLDQVKNALFQELNELSLKLQKEKPKHKRILLNDATVEKIGMILLDNPLGLLLVYDELSALIDSFSKSGREGDRSFLLSSWSGQKNYRVDRVTRDSINVPYLKLNITGTTQPDKIDPIIRNIKAAGKENDGLFHRFNYIYPERQFIPKSDVVFTGNSFEDFKKIVETLISNSTTSASNTKTFTFSNTAQIFFDQWQEYNQMTIHSGKLHSYMEAVLAKHADLLCSVALIFAVIESKDEVGSEIFSKALYWQKFFYSHAEKVFNPDYDHGMVCARELASKISEGLIYDSMSFREIYRKNWKFLKNPNSVAVGMTKLQDLNWVKIQQVKQPLGAPSEIIKINPAIKKVE